MRLILFLSLLCVTQYPSALLGKVSTDPKPWIEKLDAENFDERQAAFAALQKMGEYARKPLEKALTTPLQTDAKNAVERLLELLPPKRAIYAKIIAVVKAGETTEDTPVEAWISAGIQLPEKCKMRALTGWRVIQSSQPATLLNKPLCEIPYTAEFVQKEGSIEVQFNVPGPLPTPVHNNEVKDELGNQAIAIVGKKEAPRAFVALFVGPDPTDLKAYQGKK